MVALLSDSELEARLARKRDAAVAHDGEPPVAGSVREGGVPAHHPPARLIRRLIDVLPTLLDVLTHKGERVMLGLDAIDMRTRGFGAKELIFFTGFSHSGKTQLVNTMVLHNLDKRILFFSLDDPAEMILTKLAAMETGLSGERIEHELRDGNTNMVDMLKGVVDRLGNLVIVDDNLGFAGINTALEEATRMWGAPPELVIVDFLELMPGEAEGDAGVKSKSREFKRWVKDKPFPTVVLHQGTRSNARPGAPITLLSMAHGGEQEATILIGCRRKKDWEELTTWEREGHENTVTLHIVKNKRPGGRCTTPDGIDFYLDADTGLIAPLSQRVVVTPLDEAHEQLHMP